MLERSKKEANVNLCEMSLLGDPPINELLILSTV